jgi:hypothetical protein
MSTFIADDVINDVDGFAYLDLNSTFFADFTLRSLVQGFSQANYPARYAPTSNARLMATSHEKHLPFPRGNDMY